MRLEKWVPVAEVVASLSVVLTLLLLVIEVRANTAAIERETYVQRADRQYEPFLDPAAMPDIYAKIKAVDGPDVSVQVLMDRYGLSVEEAVIWAWYLGQNWRGREADFLYDGPSESLEMSIRSLLAIPDNRAYWEATTSQIHDELGNRAEAIESYRRFLDLWNDPDPALRPQVEAAAARLAELQQD